MSDVKIKLSALWVARMLSGLQGDSTRLHDPVALRDLLEGTSGVQVTNSLLFILSLVFVVPILMVVLSLTLPDRANRRANLGLGIAFLAFDLAFLVMTLVGWEFSAYEALWSVMYVVFVGLIVWYSWNWRPERARSS